MNKPVIKDTFFMIAAVILIVLLIANLVATGLVWDRLNIMTTVLTARRSLPCEAIPVRFVLDEPECADKLLRAMNLTNVRVSARNLT